MSSETKGFTRKWMLANHKIPAPFKKEIFETALSAETLINHVDQLKNSVDNELSVSSRVLPEDFYFNMEVFSHKHPHLPINLSRIILPFACHNEDSNVLIFVKDTRLAGGKCAKPQFTISNYETLFRKNGIDQTLITFMPLSQLLQSAKYEERRKLAFMFDQFIVDKDIAVKVNAFLGTKLLIDGRAAFPIDFSDPLTLRYNVDDALRMVFCMYAQPTANEESKCIIRFGRHSMTNENIVLNIIDLLYQLQDVQPGGCNNVSKLTIRANSNVGKIIQIYEDTSEPVYPEPEKVDLSTAAHTDADGNKLEGDESLLQKIYVHTSIIPTDHIILDREEDVSETRRDHHSNNPPQNQNSPQKTQTVANLEPQLIRVLKQLITKTKEAENPAGGGVTANRVIRRKRVSPLANNRNDRMF